MQVNIDNSHMPLTRLFAKVIEEWKEDEAGDIFQVFIARCMEQVKPLSWYFS